MSTFEEWWVSTDLANGFEDSIKESAKAAWEARVPKNFVPVPKEPTEAMCQAGHDLMYQVRGSSSYIDIYKAMIEAAQAPE